jgi:mannose-6-phosphate isomerase-like protein (cupin superfamily)
MEVFMNKGANFSCIEKTGNKVGSKDFLGKELDATGCEISLTVFANGAGSTFVHSHKRNEEIYIVVTGKGIFYVDGEELPIGPGSIFRVAPAGKRAISAAAGSDLVYYCIQVDAGSLKQATREDGQRLEDKASWM